MRIHMILIIVGMAIVTYVPRALPVLLLGHLKIEGRLEKLLQLVPYTALGALIFPGILSVNSSNPVVGIGGAITAIYLCWRKKSMTVIIIISVIMTAFLSYIM